MIAAGAARQADIASFELLALAVVGPDHDGLEGALVLGEARICGSPA